MKIENIKFKAKKTLDGKWIKGDLVHHKDSDYVWITDYKKRLTSPIDPSTVCQFTGEKDMNGKDIWEGDILEHTLSHARFTVMFDLGAFFISRNGTENTGIYLFELSEKEKCLQFFEVVSNKFDLKIDIQ